MDYVDVANMSNFTYNGETTNSQSAADTAREIIFIVFSIIGITADAAIIYTIFRFKQMRTTENIFLANWAIADLCSLIVTPSAYRIISFIDHISLSFGFDCIIFQLGSSLHATVVFFVILVAIDWTLSAYFHSRSVMFRNYYKLAIESVWIVGIFMCGITANICLHNTYTLFVDSLMFWSVAILITFSIILQCTRCIRKYYLRKPLEHSTLKLTLITTFGLCFLPAALVFNVVGFYHFHPLILVFVECIVFGSSIINIVLLYTLNRDFQISLLKALRRYKHSYNDTALNFDNPIVTNGDSKISAPISSNELQEELICDVD